MANGNKFGEVLRNKGTAMETIEDPEVVAATESDASPTSREDRIRQAAYAASERRGFEPGYETDDWLAAEREIDSATTPAGDDGPAASPTEVQAREGTRGV